jgi:hypothetical protein
VANSDCCGVACGGILGKERNLVEMGRVKLEGNVRMGGSDFLGKMGGRGCECTWTDGENGIMNRGTCLGQ